MGLLTLFDKLITEHGSATTQERNLTFLRDQIEKAEKENIEARDRISKLENEVSRLVEQKRQLAEERDRYAAEVREYQQRIKDQAEKAYRLDEAEQNVLRLFAEKKTNTLMLDSRDPAVSSLFVHKLLAPISWNGMHKGPVSMQLTVKGQKELDRIIHAGN